MARVSCMLLANRLVLETFLSNKPQQCIYTVLRLFLCMCTPTIWGYHKKCKNDRDDSEDTASNKQNLPFINKVLLNQWHHSTAGATTDIGLKTQFSYIARHSTKTERYTDNAKKGTLFSVMLSSLQNKQHQIDRARIHSFGMAKNLYNAATFSKAIKSCYHKGHCHAYGDHRR